ncbi:restriction endonuclease subunit S [Vibrio parahaemolyticus]|uniref:restriction endonuclease subunit S n=1 Tax=Vibrio parahaemolyticus TaxID=670 RepID=UPI00128F5106|nr:restriction endonuclease subunit S [Vibrio parahaemolyticus]MQF24052.1 hypothetical protein [Vibrio parahaemolyticus]
MKLPSEWEMKTLGELGTCHIGLTYKPDNVVSEGGTLVLRSSNIQQSRLVFDDNVFVNIEVPSKLKVCYGDILICVRNGSRSLIGKSAVIEQEHAIENLTFGAFMSVYRTDHHDYVRHLFHSDMYYRQIRNNLGATINQITNKNLNNFTFPFPKSSAERNKISEVLSTVDKKIDLIDQKIAETEKLKTGLMQKLFSEGVGVQDENGNWQPHTEFYLLPTGEYPQAWQPKTLNDVCEKIGDGIHTTPKYVEDSEYRFVNGNNIKNGKLVITKKTKCVSKNEYDKHKKELSLATILLSINGTIGSLAYYDGSSIVLGKSAAYLSPKEMIQKEFLYYYLSTSNVSKWFAMGLTGTTIKNLSLKTIRNTPIAIPHLKEQAAITSILTEVDKKVALLKAQKHETQQLKKGLMQKLLTGEWRVPLEETEAA